MNRMLVFLDIDGTLTEPGRNVPPGSAQKAICAARNRGHKVFICTGRNWSMLQPLLTYGFDGAIGSAGGYVLCGGTVLYDHPLSPALLEKTVDTLNRVGAAYILEARDGVYCTDEALHQISGSAARDSEAVRLREASAWDTNFHGIAEYDNSPIYKILYTTRNAQAVAEAKKTLDKYFFFCGQETPGQDGMAHGELINRNFDKGTGIRRICAHLQVSLQHTIGFGDSMNDLAMLETVGISVCMANGDPALKAVSNYVCPPVNQDGLYTAFVHWGLIEPCT